MKGGNLVGCCCAWLLSLALGQAATQLPLSIESLATKADAVVHDPKFTVGEEVVVFVVFNSRGEAVPVGMNQGRFEVFRPDQSGEAMVRNPFHGLAKRNDPRAVLKRALGQAQPLTLTELKRRVRRATK